METKTQAELIEELANAKARIKQLEVSISEQQQTITSLRAKITDQAAVTPSTAPVQQQVEARVKRRTAELEKINMDLRLSEARFRALVEQSPWSVQILSPNGITLQVNQAWVRLWGVTLEQIADYNLLEDPQLIEKGIMPFIRRAFAGEVVEIPPVLYNPDDTIPNISSHRDPRRWTRSLMYPVKDDSGVIREVVIIHEDITEQKQAEDALRKSEFRFRRLFESNIIGIMFADELGHITEANDAFLQMVGYSRAELEQGKLRWDKLSAPEDAEVDKRGQIEYRASGVCSPYQKQYIRKDGSRVDILIGSARLEPDSGSAICIVLDQTEQRRVEQALKRSEAKARRLIESNIIGSILSDFQGNILEANDAFLNMIGYSRDELEQGLLRWTDLTPPEYLPQDEVSIKECRQQGYCTPYEKAYIHKNGNIVLVLIGYALIEEKAEQVICFILDQTYRKRVEAERAELLKKEQEAHRLSYFLSEASAILASSLDYEQILRDLVRLTVPVLADWCAIDILDDEQQLRRLEIAHIDPDKMRIGLGLSQRYPLNKAVNFGIRQIMQTGQPEFVPQITDQMLKIISNNDEHLAILHSLELKSYIIVPLKIYDQVFGLISFATAESLRQYGPAELEITQELARRAATAIYNARLYQALQKSEGQFRAVFQDTVTGIAIVDIEGRVLEANPALHNMLGYGENELKSVHFADVTHPDDLAQDNEKYQLLINGEIDHFLIEKRYFCKDERIIWARLTVSAVRDQYNRLQFFIALVDDITISKQLETERAQLLTREQEARQQAEEASRLKDEFLAMISHELRTPLTSMLGWTRLLRSNRLEAEMVPKALETIERNVNAQAQLIQDLLDISRITTGKLHLEMRKLDPIPLINAAVDSIRPVAESKAIRIQLALASGVGPITGDADRLQQVLWNLLSNAVKFTGNQGQIEVELKRQEQNIAISVSDNGQGIKPEFLPYIFERFTQADSSITRNYGGLGIGLSIVKSITELHGGSVQAESNGPGQGARFTIMLPALKREEDSGSGSWRRPDLKDIVTTSTVDLAATKILVVDDEPDTCEMMRLILTQNGGVVQTANSVAEAMEIFDQWHPQVVLSDIGMPGENGYDLIRKIRQRDAHQGGNTPAIALTAFARMEDRIRALSAGFQMHVAKPVEPDELLTILSGLTSLFQKR